MKKQEKEKLTRKVTVRITTLEYKRLDLAFKRTTQRKMSEYIRHVLFQVPVTVYTRNQSYDDFVAEVILLKNELKAIGNNFNQSVKKLHSMSVDAEIKSWALLNENSKQLFFKKVEEIQQKITLIAERWSHE